MITTPYFTELQNQSIEYKEIKSKKDKYNYVVDKVGFNWLEFNSELYNGLNTYNSSRRSRKRCTGCNNYKDLSEFNKQKITKDGLRYCCRKCYKKYR